MVVICLTHCHLFCDQRDSDFSTFCSSPKSQDILPANSMFEHAIYRLIKNKYSLIDNRANLSLCIESKY